MQTWMITLNYRYHSIVFYVRIDMPVSLLHCTALRAPLLIAYVLCVT